jgi:hypothetical protein
MNTITNKTDVVKMQQIHIYYLKTYSPGGKIDAIKKKDNKKKLQ